uniref:hypothetical protein n=1 Tax=Candidatus Electronema sp. TaxID=2698783 RepID=UPI0040568B52
MKEKNCVLFGELTEKDGGKILYKTSPTATAVAQYTQQEPMIPHSSLFIAGKFTETC